MCKVEDLVAEACYAGCAVGQHIGRLHREACLVDAHAAAALAGVGYDIAHAALKSLRLAVGHTFAIATLAALLANGAIGHCRRFGALGMRARAARLLLTGGILRFAALHGRRHELAVLAARRILVAAHGALIAAQLAVLVAARVVVLGAQQAGIALLVALNT